MPPYVEGRHRHPKVLGELARCDQLIHRVHWLIVPADPLTRVPLDDSLDRDRAGGS